MLELGEAPGDMYPVALGSERCLAGRIISLIHRRLRTQAALVALHLCFRKSQLYSKPSYWTWPSPRMSIIQLLLTHFQSPFGSG